MIKEMPKVSLSPSLALAGVAALTVGLVVLPATPAYAADLTFSDAGVSACLIDYTIANGLVTTGSTGPEMLEEADIPLFTGMLDCTNYGIVDPSELAQFTSVTTLILDDNNITVFPASDFSHLTTLSVSGNGLTEFQNVDLSSATSIWAQDNALEDLNFTAPLVEHLYLLNNNISDINVLGTVMPTLVNLDVSGNRLSDIGLLYGQTLNSFTAQDQTLVHSPALNIGETVSNFLISDLLDAPELVFVAPAAGTYDNVAETLSFSTSGSGQLVSFSQPTASTVPGVFSGQISFNVNSAPLNIPDSNLKDALLNVAGLGDEIAGEITLTEALAILQLDLSNANIADLTGLEFFTNLQLVDLSGNLLTSGTLTPLESLTALTYLDVSGNNFPSLGADVANLTALETLHAHNAGVVELDGIENLTLLEILTLSDNNIHDLRPLASLLNLTSVDLTGQTATATVYRGQDSLLPVYLTDGSFVASPNIQTGLGTYDPATGVYSIANDADGAYGIYFESDIIINGVNVGDWDLTLTATATDMPVSPTGDENPAALALFALLGLGVTGLATTVAVRSRRKATVGH